MSVRTRRRGQLAPCLLTLLLSLGPTAAQAAATLRGLVGADERAEGSQGPVDAEWIDDTRAEIERELESVEDPEHRSLLQQRLEELERTDRWLRQSEHPAPLPALDPPFSLRDLDRTLERLATFERREEKLGDTVESAERALRRAERARGDARRRVAEGDADRDAVRVARDRVRLARMQLRNARLELSIAADTRERLARSAAEKRERLTVTPDDLNERVAGWDAERERLAADRDELDARVEQARDAWTKAEKAGAADARVAALRARLRAVEQERELLEARDRDLEHSIDAWTLRYRLAADELRSAPERTRARRQLATDLDDLRHERDLAEARIERLRGDVQRVEQLLERADSSDGERARWLETQVAALGDGIRHQDDYLTGLRGRIADHGRWLDAFAAEGVAQNVQLGVSELRDSLLAVWNYELATIEERSITTGKLILALGLILAGVLLSRFLSRQIRRRILDRLSMDASLASSLQMLSLYMLVLIFFLVALRSVGIPLTALAFVGGALAIGVGFGSQNVVNNFISGLILMAERPIKVGDMIEVGGTYGRVERIGGRSTRVRSGNNTHVIVPNSTFLEREVLNWTLSDTRLRTYVDVGVAYGSPTRDVAKLLERAVRKHGQILERPEPEVLFTGFGDNALEFRVYFWIRLRQILDRLRIQSDVRYAVDHLFREAGITIAFPQRDVHVDLGRPLDVRMVTRDSAEDAASDEDEDAA